MTILDLISDFFVYFCLGTPYLAQFTIELCTWVLDARGQASLGGNSAALAYSPNPAAATATPKKKSRIQESGLYFGI